MKGELAAALQRSDQRKVAAYGSPDDRGAMSGGGVDCSATQQLSGTDLDAREVEQAAYRARDMFKLAVDTGGDPADAGAALWLEGLVIGLLVAEARVGRP